MSSCTLTCLTFLSSIVLLNQGLTAEGESLCRTEPRRKLLDRWVGREYWLKAVQNQPHTYSQEKTYSTVFLFCFVLFFKKITGHLRIVTC